MFVKTFQLALAIIFACLTSDAYAQASKTDEFVRVSPATSYNQTLSLNKVAPVKSQAPDLGMHASLVAAKVPQPVAVKPVASQPSPPLIPSPLPSAVKSVPPQPLVHTVAPVPPQPVAKAVAAPPIEERPAPVQGSQDIDAETIIWDKPSTPPATVPPVPQPAAPQAIASPKPVVAPQPKNETLQPPKEDKPADTAARQPLASLSGSAADVMRTDKSGMSSSALKTDPDASELEKSLMIKIQLLEAEKEQLRRKLIQLDAGEVTPVYQCAAETTKIKDLESKVKFLTDDNQALRQKNQEMATIPKLDPSVLGELPDAKNKSSQKL